MKHPPNPKCDCDNCFVADLNAVLRRFAEQREARKVEQRNATAIRDNQAREQWRDTIEPRTGRFVERRELGTPPVDPDPEQLASQVGDLAGELRRAG